MIVLLKDDETTPPAVLPAMILLPLIPATILLTRKYIIEIGINPLAIEIIRSSLRGKEHLTYSIQDIDGLICNKRNGKGAGYFYYIKFKSGKRAVRFMTIPRFQMTQEKRNFISEKLKNITGLDVLNK